MIQGLPTYISEIPEQQFDSQHIHKVFNALKSSFCDKTHSKYRTIPSNQTEKLPELATNKKASHPMYNRKLPLHSCNLCDGHLDESITVQSAGKDGGTV